MASPLVLHRDDRIVIRARRARDACFFGVSFAVMHALVAVLSGRGWLVALGSAGAGGLVGGLVFYAAILWSQVELTRSGVRTLTVRRRGVARDVPVVATVEQRIDSTWLGTRRIVLAFTGGEQTLARRLSQRDAASVQAALARVLPELETASGAPHR